MKILLSIFLSLVVVGCATIYPASEIKPPSIESRHPVSNYAIAIIQESETINSTLVTTGVGYTKSTNPASLISGALLKRGVSRIYDIPDKNRDKLLLVTWGISGTRNIGILGDYSQEVSILMRQADNLSTVYKCTAEGIGSTEADDIREAIFSCLKGLQ
ncbi:hypothetical protein [Nitrosomonas ureae]|uniref:DUF4136 domain-containing protein n=1 Tax=Nitrosomonas ureae TaxID=44577 RepID=A0A2T5IEX8_9PROT|nr:hypothetical protein [Nitrosomonas ureae]PTQ82396.1 hypothetical protein C8R28_102729 [Nitrosomonas ureae]